MKVLWITNILFPDICRELKRQAPVTGGWMKSLAEVLIESHPDIELSVAALYGNGNRTIISKIGRITYYCLPFKEFQTAYNPTMEHIWKGIKAQCQPDLVHIHGTEYPYGLAYIKANGAENVVISIQGLVGICARYSLGQIPIDTLKRFRTVHDYLRGSLLNLPSQMERRGQIELEYIKIANHIIGRTDWDHDHIWATNPNTAYYFCNEILRSAFYEETNAWHLETCELHSIFLSQANKPIKGIHKVVEALPIILRHYPDTKIYVAGENFMKRISIKDKLRLPTYANYVCALMEKLHVRDRFIFTGLLDEDSMAKQYQKAHVFLCPSSIENSPNSLGEAQLEGVPVVASYVGGIPNMIEHGKSGLLYRFEEHEMLANNICKIFQNDSLARSLSFEGRRTAMERHCRKKNADDMYNIYQNAQKV